LALLTAVTQHVNALNLRRHSPGFQADYYGDRPPGLDLTLGSPGFNLASKRATLARRSLEMLPESWRGSAWRFNDAAKC